MKKNEKIKGHGFSKFILILIIIFAGTYYYARYIETRGLVVREYSVINKKIPESSFNSYFLEFTTISFSL